MTRRTDQNLVFLIVDRGDGGDHWRSQISVQIVTAEVSNDIKEENFSSRTSFGCECNWINLLLQEIGLRAVQILDFSFI